MESKIIVGYGRWKREMEGRFETRDTRQASCGMLRNGIPHTRRNWVQIVIRLDSPPGLPRRHEHRVRRVVVILARQVEDVHLPPLPERRQRPRKGTSWLRRQIWPEVSSAVFVVAGPGEAR